MEAAAISAAARAKDYDGHLKQMAARAEREARSYRTKCREARLDPNVKYPRNPALQAQIRVAMRRRRSSSFHSSESGLNRDTGRGVRWYDNAERRSGLTGSALAKQRVKLAKAKEKMEAEQRAIEEREAKRLLQTQLAKLDLDRKEIAIKSSSEFKRGSFLLLSNGGMHHSSRQQILRDKLGDGVDVGEKSLPWKPGYKNRINGGTRGTKVPSQRILVPMKQNNSQCGAIRQSLRLPIGYGGAVRLFSL